MPSELVRERVIKRLCSAPGADCPFFLSPGSMESNCSLGRELGDMICDGKPALWTEIPVSSVPEVYYR